VLVTTIIVGIICAGVLFFWLGYLKKGLKGSVGDEKESLTKQILEVEANIADLMQYVNSYASKGQFDTLVNMLDGVKTDLETEKGALSEIETKLDSAQKDVEGKEGLQQEIKSAKEEDEELLEGLLGNYSEISDESISLEQKLAASLKNLDHMMEEMELTAEQKAVIENLTNTLTSAGGLFRNLITEYSSVKERLDMLKQQHDDLEDEYTRLVEQQLGE